MDDDSCDRNENKIPDWINNRTPPCFQKMEADKQLGQKSCNKESSNYRRFSQAATEISAGLQVIIEDVFHVLIGRNQQPDAAILASLEIGNLQLFVLQRCFIYLISFQDESRGVGFFA